MAEARRRARSTRGRRQMMGAAPALPAARAVAGASTCGGSTRAGTAACHRACSTPSARSRSRGERTCWLSPAPTPAH
eukprot:6811633-Lingulodinium_polyedra.AAC.1